MRSTSLLCLLAACADPAAPLGDAGEELAVVAQVEAQRSQGLGEAYAAYERDPGSREVQEHYLAAFPMDCASLRREFGFEEVGPDSVDYGEFYEQGNKMIEAFFKLDSIPAGVIAARAVAIARNASWQEDGVNYFRQFMSERLERRPGEYLASITALSSKDQAGFWKFYVDGPEAYPAEDAARLRAVLVKETRQLALVDSLLSLSRTRH